MSSVGLNFFKVSSTEGEGGLSAYLFSDLISSNLMPFFGFHGSSISFLTLPLQLSLQNLLSNPFSPRKLGNPFPVLLPPKNQPSCLYVPRSSVAPDLLRDSGYPEVCDEKSLRTSVAVVQNT